ncbi:uroporphyrinogen decarboxylase family protein [Verrucomicrobiota bacterium]
MNARERFLATAGFQPVDRTFILPPWAWQETLARWQGEGLPRDADLAGHFQTDRIDDGPVRMNGRYGPHLVPPLERIVIEETAAHRIVRDEEGNTVKLFRQNATSSMPMWLEYPVRNRRDWEEIVKPRLDPTVPGRFPVGQEFEDWVRSVRDRELPLDIQAGSLYGWPRSFLGVERISLLFYDDPMFIHEMCEHITEFVIAGITPFLKRVQFDSAFYWEDMAGKAGPLCSPATYREFMLPRLKRIADLLHAHGVRHIVVDSDGNNDVLIPLWLEVGVNGLRPFEVAAGCDPVATRRKYGKDLVIQGGIDKRALAQGKDAIDREVLSKVPWLCMQGGYFPQIDHLVPPDVSLENYTHYARLIRAITEDPERYLHDAKRRGFWSGA